MPSIGPRCPELRIDRKAGAVRLAAEDTKTDMPRTEYLTKVESLPARRAAQPVASLGTRPLLLVATNLEVQRSLQSVRCGIVDG